MRGFEGWMVALMVGLASGFLLYAQDGHIQYLESQNRRIEASVDRIGRMQRLYHESLKLRADRLDALLRILAADRGIDLESPRDFASAQH